MPFAVVFSCIDSRVPPEIVFDRGIGDLFSTRTGAQTADAVALGSVEFGPDEVGTPLIFVLGHQACGAVKASIESIRTNTPAPGHVRAVVDALRPAYDVAVRQSGNMVDTAGTASRRDPSRSSPERRAKPLGPDRAYAGEPDVSTSSPKRLVISVRERTPSLR